MLCAFFSVLVLQAQKREEGFNFNFKPTDDPARYYVVTEKKDTLWHRQAWYLPEQTLAMDAWYKDSEAKVPHGMEMWYHTSRYMRSKGQYVDGLKEGAWLAYNEEGHLVDSAYYKAGRLKGTRLKFNSEGYIVDSMEFDGAGNGVEVNWYADGGVSSAGRWVQDTLKNGRWQYYHPNGKVMATEDYVHGEKKACLCYNDAGQQLDSSLCYEQEAAFPGEGEGWRKFLEKNLNAAVPVSMGAPVGQYTVMMQFIVNTDGSLSDIKALTAYGYGMEKEMERVLKRSPKWIPAHQFGRKVKAYRRQPLTFVVSKG